IATQQIHSCADQIPIANTEYVPEPKKIKTHEKEKPSQNSSNDNMNTVSNKEKPSQNSSKVNMNTVSNKVKPTTNKATTVTSRQNEVSTVPAPQLGPSRDKQTTAATRRSGQPSREPQDESGTKRKIRKRLVAVEPYRPRAGMKHHRECPLNLLQALSHVSQ
ncbi:hypothetical protein L9F63_013265, partial [Diploptera punctata]